MFDGAKSLKPCEDEGKGNDARPGCVSVRRSDDRCGHRGRVAMLGQVLDAGGATLAIVAVGFIAAAIVLWWKDRG